MLSYRHSFHAGNFADVLKHITQCLIIKYLQQKPKAFVYFDTHAGAGRYNLTHNTSTKTGEYLGGISLLWHKENVPDLIKLYLGAIKTINQTGKLLYYPGSPLLASLLFDRFTRLELSELHPTDFTLLKQEFSKNKKANIIQQDGFKNLLAKLPPIQRRGLILIDPPYELKTEYDDVINSIKKACKQFSTGIYAIWYPVVSRHQIERFCTKFKNSSIRNILRIEINVKADTNEFGMTGSGMIIINPPWTLESQMKELLPWLTKELQQDEHCNYLIEMLVPE